MTGPFFLAMKVKAMEETHKHTHLTEYKRLQQQPSSSNILTNLNSSIARVTYLQQQSDCNTLHMYEVHRR